MKNINFFFILLLISFSANAQDGGFFKNPTSATLSEYLKSNDINACIKGKTLLMAFAAGGKTELTDLLLNNGADIEAICEKKRTAFMYAAKYNQIEIAELLIEKGAKMAGKDYQNRTAYDLAKMAGHENFIETIFLKNYEIFVAPDGPHIFIGDTFHVHQIVKGKENKNIVQFASLSSKEAKNKKYKCYDKNGAALFGFSLSNKLQKESNKYKMPDKVIAISDIEGEYHAFADLLQSAGVVNKKMEWVFGEGHLVLVGDFFDRGTQVTEVLWLIYKLEQEAAAANGKVHFILGNHEELNLKGYTRYVTLKYLANAKKSNIGYVSLFAKNTVLGQWLRTKNTAVKIGKILFVHGGISPEFASTEISLATLNKISRKYIDASNDKLEKNKTAEYIFDGEYGPLWYRGYFGKTPVKEELLDAVMNIYQVNHIVVGHTPVRKISPLYGGKIIGIDVPHSKGIEYQKALLIESKNFYEINIKGEKRKLDMN